MTKLTKISENLLLSGVQTDISIDLVAFWHLAYLTFAWIGSTGHFHVGASIWTRDYVHAMLSCVLCILVWWCSMYGMKIVM